jgi:hypothetical protein
MNTKPIQFKLDQHSNWFIIPYNMNEDGRKQTIADIKNCHEQSNVKSEEHHTKQYKQGCQDGYNAFTVRTFQDNEGYGNECHKYY